MQETVFALLENTRVAEDEAGSLFFADPIAEVVCYQEPKLEEALAQVDAFRQKGFYACGYLTYEAGYQLIGKQKLAPNKQTDKNLPLLHFYIFSSVRSLTSMQSSQLLQELDSANEPVAIYDLALNMSEADYIKRVDEIHQYISSGDSYQVNFTLKYRFKYDGNPITIYKKLRERQRVEFAALLNFPEFTVLSLSPELFVRKQDTVLEAKPMKGTAARGNSMEEDQHIVDSMKRDPKMQAENIMIVDLIRNDFGCVVTPGSVSVKDLLEVQTYETLHQVISTVQGKVPKDISCAEVLRYLFPCGSVTGAPKIRTMQIIDELEVEQRGVYTGAIGYVTPENDFCFNVPIRTCIAYRDGKAEMGIGSGITYDSNVQAEFKECLLKANFFTGLNNTFQLIESMLYEVDSGTIPKLAKHLKRLATSAEALHFKCDPKEISNAMLSALQGLNSNHKVRVTLAQDRQYQISVTALANINKPKEDLLVEISHLRTNSNSLWLCHKTTERNFYDNEYEKYSGQGAYDVLFINELGQLTEASRHNLFIEKDGYLLTSPVEAGLLPGIERETVMMREKYRCIEKPLMPEDLLSADRILLTNAVRGVVEVNLTKSAHNTLALLTQLVTI